LPSSTAHRIARELPAHGILERSAGGYLVGIRLWEISARSPRGTGLRDVAMPFLQDPYEATQQHVQLAVLDGDDALLVEKISGRRAVPTIGRAGGRLPLHASGVGKAILAHADRQVQERILAGPLPRFTTRTLTNGFELRAVLGQVRREQTAYCHEELTAGAVSCAAPVLCREPLIIAAVSVVVTVATDVTMLAAAVRTAANGITRELRASGARSGKSLFIPNGGGAALVRPSRTPFRVVGNDGGYPEAVSCRTRVTAWRSTPTARSSPGMAPPGLPRAQACRGQRSAAGPRLCARLAPSAGHVGLQRAVLATTAAARRRGADRHRMHLTDILCLVVDHGDVTLGR
jgi:DNA-binding IclR family transcriptional regulator